MASSARQRHPARVLFLVVAAIVLYFFFFPYPLGLEMVARPAWAVQLPAPGAVQLPAEGDPLHPGPRRSADEAAPGAGDAPFQLGNLVGYVDPGGRLLHVEPVLFRAALSDTGFVNYARLGTDWVMYDTRGARILSFSGSGYPLLSPDGGRIFSVKTDLTGLTELDRNGDPLWSRDFPAMMASVSVRSDALLAGLLDGSLLLLNGQGSIVFEHSPGGSRIPVILGAAVSGDASLIASVSGIDPQILAVLRRDGSSYSDLTRLALASDFRREVRMSFSPDDRLLVFEGEGSAGLFAPRSRRISWIPLPGALAGFSFPGHGRFAALAAHDGARAELQILAPFTATVLRESFTARDLSLGTVDGQLLLGMDGQLLRIDIVRL